MQQRVLVTGGAGYIGSHCCKALADAGFLPVTFDNLVTGHMDAVKWGPLEIGELSSTQRLQHLIEKYDPIATIHLAAFTYVGESVTDPLKYYKNNVLDSLNFLNNLINFNVKNLIFSSSCATYGIPITIPISEGATQEPINPYGKTKLIFEHAIKDYGSAYGLRYNILRYFNAAGADAEGKIGERHNPETHIIPLAISAAFGQRSSFQLFGTDYPTPDGTAIRDYVHVTDLANAHVAAIKKLLSGGPNDEFNIGTGKGTSVKEVLNTVLNVTGRPVPVEIAPRRAGDPPILLASADRARAKLKWEPAHSDIINIVKTATNWFLKSN